MGNRVKRRTTNVAVGALAIVWLGGFIAIKEHFGWLIGTSEYMFFKILSALVFAGLLVLIFRGVKTDD